MRPEILILAGLYDFASDLVCLRLKELGTPFLRLNREQLPYLRVTLDPLGPTLRVADDERRWEITPEVRSVWYRQPVFLRNVPAEPLDLPTQLERPQWMAFVRALTIFQSAAWMNHPRETFQAEIKPYQLALAQRAGFQVAPTRVGNDAAAFRIFSEPFVAKALDGVLLRDGNDSIFTYSLITNRTELDEDSLRRAPIIAQRLLAKGADLRVTVIGNSIHAVRILRNGNPIDGDWRKIPKAELQYEEYILPPAVETACHKLMTELGLAFGGIDMIENNEGIHFIEINPTGEWGWLLSPTRQLDHEIALWLARGGHVT